MPYKLKKRLARDTDYYELDPVEKYVDYLVEQDRLVSFDNISFDSATLLLPFVCDSTLCLTARTSSCRSCCKEYAPRLSTRERERIDEILPGLCRRFPALDAAIERNGTYYEWDNHYDRYLCKDVLGWCIFLTPDKKDLGFHGCMIHAYCLENGLAPHDYKPSACIMYPLFLFEYNGGENMLVTAHTKEVRDVGEDEENSEYYEMPCLLPDAAGREPIYRAMQDTLIYMFGPELWQKLDKALRKRQAEA